MNAAGTDRSALVRMAMEPFVPGIEVAVGDADGWRLMSRAGLSGITELPRKKHEAFRRHEISASDISGCLSTAFLSGVGAAAYAS